MDTVRKLEGLLVEWFAKVPFHLPNNARRWLGQNAWWIVAIGVAFSILATISAINMLFWAESLLSVYGLPVARGLLFDISLWINMAALVIVVILELKAIQPLKRKEKSGWDLIFIAAIVGIASSLVVGVLSGSIVSAVFGVVIAVAISGFFLFETRGEFKAKKLSK